MAKFSFLSVRTRKGGEIVGSIHLNQNTRCIFPGHRQPFHTALPLSYTFTPLHFLVWFSNTNKNKAKWLAHFQKRHFHLASVNSITQCLQPTLFTGDEGVSTFCYFSKSLPTRWTTENQNAAVSKQWHDCQSSPQCFLPTGQKWIVGRKGGGICLIWRNIILQCSPICPRS